MEIKPMHLMTYCPTRMSCIVLVSPQIVKMLLPIYKISNSADIKRRNMINSCSQGVIIVHLAGDLEPVLFSIIFKKLHQNDGLTTMVYNAVNAFSARLQSNFETPKLDKF